MAVMEWDFPVAMQKLIDLLNLDPARYANVGHELKMAVSGEVCKSVSQDRLDCAMRQIQNNAEFGVSESTLKQALVRFYLEIQGVTIPDSKLAFDTTTRERLCYLVDECAISSEQCDIAIFFYITGKCTQGMARLRQRHRTEEDAIRIGLSTNQLTEVEARIATFCRITHGEPSEARRFEADKDLGTAVFTALGEEIHSVRGSAKYLDSLFFPLDTEWRTIRDHLRDKYINGDATNLAAVRETYLLDFFKRRNGCRNDEKASIYLQLHGWSMVPASRAYIGDLPEEMSDVSDVSELVSTYEQSKPSQTCHDHEVAYMIDSFQAGRMEGDARSQGILRAQLVFRNAKCELAMKIVTLMGFSARDIAFWNPHGKVSSEHRSRMNRLSVILKQNTTWFRPSQESDGRSYEKPYLYVANAMAQENKTDEEVLELVAKVKEALSEEVASA